MTDTLKPDALFLLVLALILWWVWMAASSIRSMPEEIDTQVLRVETNIRMLRAIDTCIGVARDLQQDPHDWCRLDLIVPIDTPTKEQ